MNKTDVKVRILDIIGSKSGHEGAIGDNYSLSDDLGLDSLDQVELMMDLEKEFGIQIPEDEAAFVMENGGRVREVINGVLFRIHKKNQMSIEEMFEGDVPEWVSSKPSVAPVKPKVEEETKPQETEITETEIRNRRWKKDQPCTWEDPQWNKKSGKYQLSLFKGEDDCWVFQVDQDSATRAVVDVKTFEQTEVILEIIKTNDNNKRKKRRPAKV